MGKRKPFKIVVKGLEWTFYVQLPTTYKRQHGGCSEGITYPETQEVFLNRKFLSPRTVRHELLHVYYASCCVESGHLKKAQVEEVCASIVGHHLDHIQNDCTTILEFFKNN